MPPTQQFVQCTTCDFAANVEAVAVPAPDPVPFDGIAPAAVMDTPDTPTIATLVDLFNRRDDLRRDDRAWEPADTLKNVVVMVKHPDGSREPLVIGVPGDRDVDPKRLEAALLPSEAEPFSEEDFAAHPELTKGYIGPGVLGEARGLRYLLDPRVVAGTAWITGADADGKHVMNLVAGRDFTADGTIDVADIRDGDPCPQCGSELRIARGVEIGHIFQLGRRYAEALDLKVLDQKGKEVVVTMGSYGIGVTRCIAAIVEATHDELGLAGREGGSGRRARRDRRKAGQRAVSRRRAVGGRAGGIGRPGPARRQSGHLAGREVQRRRTGRSTDDRRRRTRARRRHG